MHFKSALCQVVCLVTTVILQSATAQHDSISLESLSYNMEKLEQNIMDKLHALLEQRINYVKQEKIFDNDNHTLQNGTNAQEVMEQIGESFNKVKNITDGLLAGQSEILKQLTNVTNGLQQWPADREKAYGDEFHKLRNSTDTQLKEVIEKVVAQATNVQQMAETIENLRNITDNFVARQSDVWKQLTGVKNDSFEGDNQSNIDVTPSSCTTLNTNATGSYYIHPEGAEEPFLVFCDFASNYNLGGGWTVFQHRFDGEVDFYRNWTMYKDGFGDVNGEHWLGLEKLHAMTKSGRHELLIILEDHDDASGYALYDNFQIGSEAQNYTLTVGSYSGTAGDSLGQRHNGMQFSTYDHDNVEYPLKCAKLYRGAWWFKNCFHSHLNGKYFKKGEHLNKDYHGLFWQHWTNWDVSLKSTKMMFRRRSG